MKQGTLQRWVRDCAAVTRRPKLLVTTLCSGVRDYAAVTHAPLQHVGLLQPWGRISWVAASGLWWVA